MKKIIIVLLVCSQNSHAGWSVFKNMPKDEKEFVGACMNTGSFLKFSAALLQIENCKLDEENTHAIICKENGGASKSAWFETQEECNKYRSKIKTTDKQPNKK